MAAEDYQILSTPQIIINNVVVSIVPGSLKIKLGRGHDSVKAQSAGGSTVSLVFSQNVETRVGEVKFQLFVLPANFPIYENIKNNNPLNAISMTHPTLNIQYFFGNASLVNDPEWNASPDGVVDFEFMTAPAV